MTLDKAELISLVLTKFADAQPSFRIRKGRLELLDEEAALLVLRYNGVQLLAQGIFDMESSLRTRLVCMEMQEIHFQTLLKNELDRVVRLLLPADIPILVVKGLALKRYYTEKLMRPTSDIDLVVPPRHRMKSLEILFANGYFTEDANMELSLDLGGEVGLRAHETGIVVELHWDLVNSRSMRKATTFDMEDMFALSEPQSIGNSDVRGLPIELEAIYLMVHHVMHHEFTRLIWFIDVLNLLFTEELDFEKLEKFACEYGAQRPVHYVLSAAKDIVPESWTAEHEFLLRRLAPLPFRYHFFKSFVPSNAILSDKRSKWVRLKHHLFRNAFK